jgi:hypothetical protein
LQGLPTLRQAQGSQPGAGRACRSRSGFPHLSQPSASSGFAARRRPSLPKPKRIAKPAPTFGRLRVRSPAQAEPVEAGAGFHTCPTLRQAQGSQPGAG